ncbi:MAG: nucleotide sugar dehydrogenase [Deferribacterales bacterium]
MSSFNHKICIIGLGYVGLPLSVAFAQKGYSVKGFDIAQWRIDELSKGTDRTLEVSSEDLKSVSSGDSAKLKFTNQLEEIKDCNTYIVTVPTPIDEYKNPDLTPLIKASETVGKVLSKGDIVIYESTVYPGCTENDCVPVLEKFSGMTFNKDFFCGYSPERVNPGDKNRPLTNIMKITSGSTPEIAEIIDNMYKSIITAGTHRASCIMVAEAAKVIENTQRDLNIALMNELALIFDRMGINTNEVIEAAGTKWNFLKFHPGLVGGHCIGVDPYYLTFKSQAIGYNPDMIISGRRVNDSMGKFIAEKATKEMIKAGKRIKGSNVLIAGFTFKEDCPDVRNTKVIDIYNELIEYGMCIDVYDPVADVDAIEHEYDIKLMSELKNKAYDAIIIAVKHKSFYEQFKAEKLNDLYNDFGILIDVKSMIDKNDLPENISYWSL